MEIKVEPITSNMRMNHREGWENEKYFRFAIGRYKVTFPRKSACAVVDGKSAVGAVWWGSEIIGKAKVDGSLLRCHYEGCGEYDCEEK